MSIDAIPYSMEIIVPHKHVQYVQYLVTSVWTFWVSCGTLTDLICIKLKCYNADVIKPTFYVK